MNPLTHRYYLWSATLWEVSPDDFDDKRESCRGDLLGEVIQYLCWGTLARTKRLATRNNLGSE
jgi:hypothetical protein